MKTFKNFILNKIKTYIPNEPLHFRMGLSRAKPTKVKKNIKEEEESNEYHDWLNKSDNGHLGDTGNNNDERTNYKNAHRVGSQLNKKTKKITEQDSEHIEEYTGAGSEELNDALLKKHKQGKGLPSEHVEQIRAIDKAANHPIGHHLHVYSGIRNIKNKMNSGDHMHLPAYTSTTHSKHIANTFAAAKADKNTMHIAHIHLKPTDKAGYVARHSMNDHEHETILPRNTTLKHTHTTKLKNSFPHTVYDTGGDEHTEQPNVHIHHFEVHHQE